MSEKHLNVFIQDLKDTTTVLQQLELCISNLKSVLTAYDNADFDNISENIVSINSELDNINDAIDIINGTIENISLTLSHKQNELIVGDNIQINNDVISATDTTYTAGSNIQINNNVISATDTTYTAGTNVQINDGVISATDTTYNAGNGIGITSNTISVDTDIIASKDYVDNLANLTLYEYELEFIDGTMEESWYYRFYSGHANIATPSDLSELKQLIQNYGINKSGRYSLLGYSEINATLNFSKCYVQSNKLYVTQTTTSTDLEVATVNYIALAKRTC